MRAIRKLEYEHEGSRFELEVGKTRLEFRRQTGPRGGHRKDAHFERIGRSTGGMIVLVVDVGHLIEVFSSPAGRWANPSYVGRNEVSGAIEYFDEFIGLGGS